MFTITQLTQQFKSKRSRNLSYHRTVEIDFSKATAQLSIPFLKSQAENNVKMTYNPHQKEDHFGRGVTANQKATIRAFDKFYSWFPSFLDVFPDEDAWLNFVFWFVLATIVVTIIIAKRVTIKPHML